MTVTLKDPSLFRQAALVGETGSMPTRRMRSRSTIRRPARSSACVPKLGAAETKAAIEAARIAQKGWAARTAKERCASCANGTT